VQHFCFDSNLSPIEVACRIAQNGSPKNRRTVLAEALMRLIVWKDHREEVWGYGMFQELTVDLRRAPEDRWHLTPAQCQQARELLGFYKADFDYKRTRPA
jgi:hypothetical protein